MSRAVIQKPGLAKRSVVQKNIITVNTETRLKNIKSRTKHKVKIKSGRGSIMGRSFPAEEADLMSVFWLDVSFHIRRHLYFPLETPQDETEWGVEWAYQVE